jgi:adenylate kinase
MLDSKPFIHISTGNLLREAIQQKSPLGVEAQSYVDAGKLVPDSVVIGLVREFIDKNKTSRFIFDGFPRTIVQAEALESQIEEIGAVKIQKALFLEVPQADLLQRLSGRRVCKNCGAVYHEQYNPPKKLGTCDNCAGEVYQRKDDAAEAIQTRLEAYEKSTAPLKEYYIKKNLFVSIDGLGSSKDVFGRIQTYL